jgi:hypothetical protein
MGTPLIEAYETIRQSESLVARVGAAAADLAKRPGLLDEKSWLEASQARLQRAREGVGDVLERALRLEELEPMRGDHTRKLQGEAVDALERLQGGIAYAISPRSPLIEALFLDVKTPLLRKLDREGFEKACGDFEKRLTSGYVKRVLADPDYAPVASAVKETVKAIDDWRGWFDPPPLPDAEATALCEELVTAAHRIDAPMRQARLLAQAALLSTRDLLEEYGLTPKARRRGQPDPDTHALLEQDPPDPSEPTPEELEELEAQRADAKTKRGR